MEVYLFLFLYLLELLVICYPCKKKMLNQIFQDSASECASEKDGASDLGGTSPEGPWAYARLISA